MRWQQRLKQRMKSEDGVVMVYVILATFMLTLIATLITAFVAASTSSVRLFSGTTNAFDAAEAGVDTSIALLQTPGGSLPCEWDTVYDEGEEATTGTVNISYYSDYDGTTQLTCNEFGVSGSPLSAVIDSTAVAADGESRTVQVLARLSQATAPAAAFDKAIFSDNLFNPQTQLYLNGYAGNDADIYSNGDVEIKNNVYSYGDIAAQGWVYLHANPRIEGTIHAAGYVYVKNNSFIGGNIISNESDPSPYSDSVTLWNGGTVVGNVMATGSVRLRNNPSVGSVSAYATGLSDPPQEPFPVITSDTAGWTGAGFQVVTKSSCSAATDFLLNVGNEWSNLAASHDEILLRVPACSDTSTGVTFGNQGSVVMYSDLAIVTDDGLRANNNFNITSSGGERQLWMVVPADSPNVVDPFPSCTSGTEKGDIYFKNNWQVSSDVKTFIYSPCNLSIKNNGGMKGMLYGGIVEVKNDLHLSYFPMDVPGASSSGGTTTTSNYQVDTVYKREVPGTS